MNLFSEFAAIIGIDWADRKHDLCLKIFGSDALEYSILEHKPEAIDDWTQGLRVRFNAKPVSICIEPRNCKIQDLTLSCVSSSTIAKFKT